MAESRKRRADAPLDGLGTLRRMQLKGASPVTVLRVDSGDLPEKYPVFIRSEDGCAGPETGLIENAERYVEAVAALKRSGKPAKGRIALSYETEAAVADGNRTDLWLLWIHGDQLSQHDRIRRFCLRLTAH